MSKIVIQPYLLFLFLLQVCSFQCTFPKLRLTTLFSSFLFFIIIITSSILVGPNAGFSAIENFFTGFGSEAAGGSGGKIVYVTNLNDSGEGSLRDAVSRGNQIVKFNVSGTIILHNSLNIPSNISIDGLSAPTPGITLSPQNGFPSDKTPLCQIRNKNNIIIQGIRFRGPAYDTLRISHGSYNIIVDHCSFSGSTDGALDITEGSHHVTVSWNIFARTGGSESKTMLLKYGAYYLSLHHNIFVTNERRNPWIAGHYPEYYRGTINYREPVADMRNNIVCDWKARGTRIDSRVDSPQWKATANVVNNLYSSKIRPNNAIVLGNSIDSITQAYIDGNILLTHSAGNSQRENTIADYHNELSNHDEFPVPSFAQLDTEPTLIGAYNTFVGAGVHPRDDIDSMSLDSINIPLLDDMEPPVAHIINSTISALPEELITFDGSESYDWNGNIISYQWYFGDGATDSGKIVSHRYSSSGTFKVILTVTDNDGLRSEDTSEVTILGNLEAPTAVIAHGDRTVFINEEIEFNGANSYDGDGVIVSYEWDLGDGKTDTGPTISHAYTKTGEFIARLIVIDNDGQTNETAVTVSVQKVSDEIMLNAEADTFVINGRQENNNYGKKRYLRARFEPSDVQSFIRFDLSSLPDNVSSAKFKLYVEKRKKAAANLLVYLVDDNSWDEYALTYRNKPIVSEIIAALTIIDKRPMLVEFDVTDAVIQKLTKDNKQLSLCISNTDNTLVKFRSREHKKEDTVPHLIIQRGE